MQPIALAVLARLAVLWLEKTLLHELMRYARADLAGIVPGNGSRAIEIMVAVMVAVSNPLRTPLAHRSGVGDGLTPNERDNSVF